MTQWRVVGQADVHFAALAEWCAVKRDGTVVGNLRVTNGAPDDAGVRHVLDDFGVPLDTRSCRALGHPEGTAATKVSYTFQVLHDARQVLKVAPEAVQLGNGLVDGDALRDVDAAFRLWLPAWRAGRRLPSDALHALKGEVDAAGCDEHANCQFTPVPFVTGLSLQVIPAGLMVLCDSLSLHDCSLHVLVVTVGLSDRAEGSWDSRGAVTPWVHCAAGAAIMGG